MESNGESLFHVGLVVNGKPFKVSICFAVGPGTAFFVCVCVFPIRQVIVLLLWPPRVIISLILKF